MTRPPPPTTSIALKDLLPLLRRSTPIPHLIREFLAPLEPRLGLRQHPRRRLILDLLAKHARFQARQRDQRPAQLGVFRHGALGVGDAD